MNELPDRLVDGWVDEVIDQCLHLDAPQSFFMYAGAGSGKTRSLVEALGKLRLRERERLVYRGQRIAVITYTNAARDEILRRIEFDPLVDVSTIHSFAWRLIQGFDDEIRQWLKVSIEESMAKLADAMGRARGVNKTYLKNKADYERKEKRLEALDSMQSFNYSPSGTERLHGSLTHQEVIDMAGNFLQKDPLREVLVDLYPVILIDESQDTHEEMMEALLSIQAYAGGRFALGLLGDTMQRIYTHGMPRLEAAVPGDWARPVKVMNHRSAERIVRLVNNIRTEVDGQQQRSRVDKPGGFARLFITGLGAANSLELEEKIARNMADITGDAKWGHGPEQRKTLVLEHRMASRRLGFDGVFGPLYETETLRTSLLDGVLGPVNFLVDDVLPIVAAGLSGDEFALVDSVRTRSPLFDVKALAGRADQLDAVRAAGDGALRLSEQLLDSDPPLREVISGLRDSGLLAIPHALLNALEVQELDDGAFLEGDRAAQEMLAWHRVLRAPFSQVRAMALYARGLSAFDTHQGVKGLEFPRVLVVISDDEANGFTFSYEKVFGVKAVDKDVEKEAVGGDSQRAQTRRLLYVTCSRAERSLALMVYAQNPEAVRDEVIRKEWFSADEIVLI
ncbi:UvrD-helicase domain-containing protein [Stenotrophomonas indicatrix]|uniref:UvrD-helicase domain-containing protein n=1 Tax=Stenotrophomonas indicatrix TaxID=2045451 RepID=UPI00200676EE|nr:UvrD-helicase domain-containing protein [Stenotrophomonas indicatrix]MCK6229777.1 AAA family ATPase [Stenotrophomonas indicatrix]